MEKTLSRNKAHDIALFAIYDVLTYSAAKLPAPIEDIVSGLTEQSFADSDFFVKEMVLAMVKHYQEIISVEKTDKAIIINVSVELAKKYLSDNDYKFVNAILDKVLA